MDRQSRATRHCYVRFVALGCVARARLAVANASGAASLGATHNDMNLHPAAAQQHNGSLTVCTHHAARGAVHPWRCDAPAACMGVKTRSKSLPAPFQRPRAPWAAVQRCCAIREGRSRRLTADSAARKAVSPVSSRNSDLRIASWAPHAHPTQYSACRPLQRRGGVFRVLCAPQRRLLLQASLRASWGGASPCAAGSDHPPACFRRRCEPSWSCCERGWNPTPSVEAPQRVASVRDAGRCVHTAPRQAPPQRAGTKCTLVCPGPRATLPVY